MAQYYIHPTLLAKAGLGQLRFKGKGHRTPPLDGKSRNLCPSLVLYTIKCIFGKFWVCMIIDGEQAGPISVFHKENAWTTDVFLPCVPVYTDTSKD
jgi:hypothetical protein